MHAMASKRQNHYFPIEIWTLILCKLPVESLVRFRSVCKAWHHVIGTTFFVKTHLNHQKTSPNTNKYMLHVQLHYSTFNTDCEAIFDDTTDSKLYYTSESFGKYSNSNSKRVMRIYGICDGLLCVSNKYYSAGNDIHLWNPICRKAKKLPKLEISVKKDVSFDHNGVMSFGYYDDDYKVIVISPLDKKTSYIVSVYSLRSDCWRTFPSSPSYFNFVTGDSFLAYQPTRFIDGTAYMLTCYNQVLVYFDLRDEISRQLELPEGNPTQNLGVYALEAYREKLAVFRCGETEMNMWILTDKYSSMSPWEKKFVIKLPELELTRPVGFLHNGKYLVKTYFAKKKMTMYYLCDPESPKLVNFKPRDGTRPHEFFYNIVSNCVESLLLLDEDSLDPFVGSEMGSSCNSSRLFTLYNYKKIRQ